MNTSNYPKFEYKAVELSAFSFCIDTFVISLKNGRIVHFVAEDPQDFKAWLIKSGIRDIRKDDGKPKIIKAAKV